MFAFREVALLPESFARYSTNMRNNAFQEAVAGYLNWPPSPNNRSMSMAAGILVMVSDPTLGTASFLSLLWNFN